ncbi:lysylphosphatidylglycerol synthase transmembrane domain-containing protein [Hydrogenophaga sp. RWCD_12]|uniref:lysylphosphatidylglycerol synthase transmembrane domain-containing protein n=1 Tax=Hydrogenophaga sp. RWCD_12 TaxID=3391190 RepID=UPI003984FFF5
MSGFSRLLRWLPLVLLGGLIAYVVIAQPFDWHAVLHHIVTMSPLLWAQLLGVFVVCYAARIWRWVVFTRAVGVDVPLWRNAVIYMSGFGMGLMLHKAGEAMRVLYLRPYGMSYANGVGAFLADRLLDILIAGLLACSGIALFTGHSDWAVAATAVCLVAMWVLRSSLAREFVRRLPLGRLSAYAHEGMHAMSVLLSGKTLWRAVALSVATWCAQGSALYFALQAMGSPVDWTLAVAAYSIGLFAGAAAIVPGGLGAAEAAIMLLLVSKGVDKEVALAAAVVGRGVPQWAGMLAGLLSMAFLGSAAEPAAEAKPAETA